MSWLHGACCCLGTPASGCLCNTCADCSGSTWNIAYEGLVAEAINTFLPCTDGPDAYPESGSFDSPCTDTSAPNCSPNDPFLGLTTSNESFSSNTCNTVFIEFARGACQIVAGVFYWRIVFKIRCKCRGGATCDLDGIGVQARRQMFDGETCPPLGDYTVFQVDPDTADCVDYTSGPTRVTLS